MNTERDMILDNIKLVSHNHLENNLNLKSLNVNIQILKVNNFFI